MTNLVQQQTEELQNEHSPDIAVSQASSHRDLSVSFRTLEPTEDVDALVVEADWYDLFQRDETAGISLHPQSIHLDALANVENGEPAVIIGECHCDDELVALVALLPRQKSLQEAGGLLLPVKLNGFVLAGQQVLGQYANARATLLCATIEWICENHYDFLIIEDVEEKSTDHQNLLEFRQGPYQLFSPGGFENRHRTFFGGTPNTYWQKFSKNSRKSLRKRVKKIGNVKLEAITTADQVPDFLQKCHEISKQSWQSQHFGLRIKNNEQEQRRLTFLAEVGALRSFLLYREGKPIAFEIAHQYRGIAIGEESAYLRELAEFSPGQVAQVLAFESLIESNTPTLYDFGSGDSEYKRFFGNDISQMTEIWIMPRGVIRSSCINYIRFCRFANRMARRVLTRLGLMNKLRQWRRRTGH